MLLQVNLLYKKIEYKSDKNQKQKISNASSLSL